MCASIAGLLGIQVSGIYGNQCASFGYGFGYGYIVTALENGICLSCTLSLQELNILFLV
jgi:hypothetical protein